MFPNNEFWQCPSYAYSMFILSILAALILVVASQLLSESGVDKVAKLIGVFMIFWILRVLYRFFVPNKNCEAKGFPGQHYINPFYEKESPLIEPQKTD